MLQKISIVIIMEQRKGSLLAHVPGPDAVASITRRDRSKDSPKGLGFLLVVIGLTLTVLSILTLVANKDVLVHKSAATRAATSSKALRVAIDASRPAPRTNSRSNENTNTPLSLAFDEVSQLLMNHVNTLKKEVKVLRSEKHLVMPWDPVGLEMTGKLQTATRCYLAQIYGNIDKRIVIAMSLKFPEEMLKAHTWLQSETSASGNLTLLIELAPMSLLPHATFTVRLTN